MKFDGNSKIQFLKSATQPAQYPVTTLPEIAILGRSNAGKSSFINALFNTKVAKVSSTPGKTTLLNFFKVSEKYNIVDVPGYGYAVRSQAEKKSWRPMVESYISLRSQLGGVILVMDIRRDWSVQETDLVDWVYQRGDIDVLLVLTKADKLSKSQQIQAQNKIQKASGLEHVFSISATKKTGIKEVEDFYFNAWLSS